MLKTNHPRQNIFSKSNPLLFFLKKIVWHEIKYHCCLPIKVPIHKRRMGELIRCFHYAMQLMVNEAWLFTCVATEQRAVTSEVLWNRLPVNKKACLSVDCILPKLLWSAWVDGIFESHVTFTVNLHTPSPVYQIPLKSRHRTSDQEGTWDHRYPDLAIVNRCISMYTFPRHVVARC